MPGDVQPVPLLAAACDALTKLSAKFPPTFVEIVVSPYFGGGFPTPYHVEAAIRAEAKRRAALQDKPATTYYDEFGESFLETPPPKPPDPQMKDLRAATRCPPNGEWVIYVVSMEHDPKSYW